MSQVGGGADGPGDRLWVRGGSGGTAVGLEALDAAAGVLADVAQEVALVVWRVGAVATDADLVAGSVLSPVTGAGADAALAAAAGPAALSGDATGLVALSTAVRAAAAAYRRGEAAATRAVERAQDTVMFVVGGLAPEILVGVLALDALGVDVAGLLDQLAFDEPGIADLAGGTEGLVVGLRSNPLTSPFLPAPPRTDGLTDDQDYEAAVRMLADSAAPWGLLSDRGRARVTAEPSPRAGAGVPLSLEDLAADQRNLGDGEDYAGHVRVIEVPQAKGSAWIVEISGTQVWDPRAGQNPFDVTTDVRSMAQDATLLADGVQQALEQAQAASAAAGGARDGDSNPGRELGLGLGPEAATDPVMLVGHSLGGIAAAGLASSPRFTQAHQVTHVVTMGSPVGRMPVPAGIEVLSLEHTQDAVPRLDGQANPDRATWVTVSRDLGDGGVDRASEAHDTRHYIDTAALVDDSAEPSVATWRTTSTAFFAGDDHGEPVVRDFAIERVAP
ncbi:hypothetical protein [Pedococcus bigeumensis]|uniref:GPI inositol-deacylase PGAP1-like alpha/beta domain-containing protein n=1 Tax=Pedococcus bigeumensis TaxID=433644 RepID=A0A502CQH2_9MICO|nr:hypothetical protein [Pedococcus bigeumensis]TPG14780.1 hypothetical protein EAH86_14520 [Pedococcus bigeumensis]